MRARLLFTALVLVGGLSLRVTAADAFQTMSELRALVCCEQGCDDAATARTTARCCGVEREGQKVTGTAPLELPPVSWVAVSPAFLAPPGVTAARGRLLIPESPPARGAPVFLLTRSIRI